MLIYFWINKCPYNFIKIDIDISKNTIIEWAKEFRYLCAEILVMDSKPIGGIVSMITIKMYLYK